MLLPTQEDVDAAFIEKCVVRLTDSLPLSQLNEKKLMKLLKERGPQQYFAYHFKNHSKKLVSEMARSITFSFNQLSRIVSFTLDEAKNDNNFFVGLSFLEATVDLPCDRENNPEYAMFALNHLVRNHSIWQELRIWEDAFYRLLPLDLMTFADYQQIMKKTKELTPSQSSISPNTGENESEVTEDMIPCNNVQEFELYKKTLIADKIVFSMHSLEVAKETIESFINIIIKKNVLDNIHKQFLLKSIK